MKNTLTDFQDILIHYINKGKIHTRYIRNNDYCDFQIRFKLKKHKYIFKLNEYEDNYAVIFFKNKLEIFSYNIDKNQTNNESNICKKLQKLVKEYDYLKEMDDLYHSVHNLTYKTEKKLEELDLPKIMHEYYIHCEEEIEARLLLKRLEELGYCWSDGDIFSEKGIWYYEDYVYYFVDEHKYSKLSNVHINQIRVVLKLESILTYKELLNFNEKQKQLEEDTTEDMKFKSISKTLEKV